MVTHPLWRPYQPHANADRQTQRLARRQTPPGNLQPHDDAWQSSYEDIAKMIMSAVPDQVVKINHVGSTAVPDLIAKPVIDIDLTVPDAVDEAAYLPRLEDLGFRLIFRDDLAGDSHRQLTYASPNANLHVWSPGAVEPQRHALFVQWLRAHSGDRDRYAEAKRRAVRSGETLRYNDVKASVVYDIYELIFAADPAHDHDPQPITPVSRG